MSDEKPPSSQPQQKSFIDRVGHFFKGEPQDKEDLMEILKDAHEKHLMDDGAFSMIEGILKFSEMRVTDVMIPRIQMKVVERDADLESIFPKVLELGHSRFPVIEDDRSEVVGVLLAKDLLGHAIKNKKLQVGDLMRPISIVPESKRLNVLLKEFRTERRHMAVVVDEYGMVAGLVTIEDVLEEIVGEIEDEHDAQEIKYIEQCSSGKYNLKAITPIDDFNEYFSADLTDDEHETIGGFVIHQLGHMPKKGEKIVCGRFRFEVIHADNRRVTLLKVKILKEAPENLQNNLDN